MNSAVPFPLFQAQLPGAVCVTTSHRSLSGLTPPNYETGEPFKDSPEWAAWDLRTWHYAQTLPWSDGGSRLLPMKNFFDYKATLNDSGKFFHHSGKEFPW